MKSAIGITTVVSLALVCAASGQGSRTRDMSRKELRDRIAGGWAGQMIGVSFGAPTEFRSNGAINEKPLPPWTPDRVSNSLGQDDLYVDMTFAKVLDDKGLAATTDDFGAMFREAKYSLWHANLAARRALRRGVPASLSGTPKYNVHANDIDFQIESDFVGLMTPGLHRSATDIALRAGRVMNYGDGLYGGVFVAAMYTAAFFEADPLKVVQAGLASIPAKSPYGLLIADLLKWYKQNPDDWKKTWRLLEQNWDKNDPCPEGALRPFNIDAKLNGAYIALGLLYGKKDFGRTIEIATRAGQDSDCNPASAGGILGVMLGYSAIPEEYKGGIPAIADKKFQYTDFSFNSIVDSTEKRALALIEKTGGGVAADKVTIRTQSPEPPKLETWNYGTVAERVAAGDKRWTFTGAWRSGTGTDPTRSASEKGAEASIAFDGTGAIVVGPYYTEGGRADVYLDGRLDRTVDVASDEPRGRTNESVWHVFGLQQGRHRIRVVVRGEPYGNYRGTAVGITDLVVFR
jgi:hypothetical protein